MALYQIEQLFIELGNLMIQVDPI